jgi:hypothetical protein
LSALSAGFIAAEDSDDVLPRQHLCMQHPVTAMADRNQLCIIHTPLNHKALAYSHQDLLPVKRIP